MFWKGKHGPVLIAEIGGNHEGDFEYARELLSLAIESDVDYIKFQIYTGDTLVNPKESPVRNSHFKKFELTIDQHVELAEICIKHGKKYMASIWDASFFSALNPYMNCYKVGSGDLTAYPVLKNIASQQKPIIVSTGLANSLEVTEAIRFIESCNNFYLEADHLAILQCTSMYPISYEDANLSVMDQYSKLFPGRTIGYSDHTEGSYAMEIAVAMGAQILEFHFTDSREGKSFRDHKVSLTKDEVHDLIARINDINKLKGVEEKSPTTIEKETDHIKSFRRGIYPARNISKGEIIREEDLICLRPAHGLEATQYYKLIGKKAAIDLMKFEPLKTTDFI